MKTQVYTKQLIEKAKEIVSNDREKTYLDLPLNGLDVALMMTLLKVARTKAGSHNPDDYVDMVGYSAIAGELAEKGNNNVK